MPEHQFATGRHSSTPPARAREATRYRASKLRKLRPVKVRNAVRRRWFEYRIARLKLHDAPGLVDLGTRYGGWTIPGALVEPSWVCYSVGVGGDISFDLELIHRYAVEVRAFDAVLDYVTGAIEQAGNEPRFSARQAAIAVSDGPIRMQFTHHPGSLSVSSAGLYESRDFSAFPGRTIPSLMAELGDERIDLLKLDIEGSEYAVVPTIDLAALGVKIFSTQLHHTGSVREARKLIARLREAGYEPVACRPKVKITFAHADLLAGRRSPG
jgi:FkbM family methyltransferase